MPGHDPCQTLGKLLTTMHVLRSPEGCPWDAQQTPNSLAPYILEEACEVIEAIESGTTGMILDELGDLLLQIVFQAQIFSERGDFDFADVAAGIDAKLIRRHPHVFTNQDRQISTDELARQWEHIKREERSGHPPHPLGQIPVNLPALQRAQKLISRATRMNIEVTHPLLQDSNDERLTEEELGMTLLALVKQAERSGLDAEQSLRKTVRGIIDTQLTRPHDLAGKR